MLQKDFQKLDHLHHMIVDDTIPDSRVVSVTADGLAQRENIPDLVVFSKLKKKDISFLHCT